MTSEAEIELQQKYVQKLPEKLLEIEFFFQEQDRASLQSAVHKLSGSAGMYGFDSISKISSELEEMIVAEESLLSEKVQHLLESLKTTIKKLTTV